VCFFLEGCVLLGGLNVFVFVFWGRGWVEGGGCGGRGLVFFFFFFRNFFVTFFLGGVVW